ncbi:MAG: rod-binding protein [Nitrospirota bacterium]
MSAYDFLIHFNNKPQSSLRPTAQSSDQALKMACQEFEALFLEYLLSAMRKSIPKSGFLGNSKEEEMYTSLFDQELCVKLSQQKGLGLGDLLYNQLHSGLPSEEKDTTSPVASPSEDGPPDNRSQCLQRMDEVTKKR